ncbi:MAG: cbb3-type cytochrome c oxidase subunit II [Desulfobulbaceae bacterium]|nr:cbb3-type cytochrome c oxidase subunit II [Desulfobulbaceae bacterium]
MWEKKPILLLVLATLAIMVGTVITMVLPFKWINGEGDRIASVKPYNALQLAGRDVYIREGCNNCHSQVVRPLVADVLRYGDYSKSGEFVYDQPHLWGSRRMGPDLARVGGKYPDAWHVQHMKQPKVMIPQSNMPAYTALVGNAIDPAYTEKKMKVLGFPYNQAEIQALAGKTELDALIAYLQKLGSDIPWRQQAKAVVVGDLVNPFVNDAAAIAEGAKLFDSNCDSCHDLKMESDDTDDVGPPLTNMKDFDENDLFTLIHDGTGAGMPSFASIGVTGIWKIVNFLKNHKEGDDEGHKKGDDEGHEK